MSTKPERGAASAVADHRRRLRDRELRRVEVQVRGYDATLVRTVAAAPTDPGRVGEARALLCDRFGAGPAHSLKDLLAAAPLEGVELERFRSTGRPVDL